MPYKAPLGPIYDCGEFAKNMEIALEASDYAGFAADRRRRAPRASCGALRSPTRSSRRPGPVPEYAEIRFQPSGSAMLLLGTKTHGQGHETAFKQILHEKIGIDPADVHFIDGDTDRVAFGMGSNGSRSMVDGRHGAGHCRQQSHRERQEDRGANDGSRGRRHRV